MKTLQEWRDHLGPRYSEALEDVNVPDSTPCSPREILDVIVRYEGGIASSYAITGLIQKLWGVHLPVDALW